MSSLIKNELTKIFRKKTIYIAMIAIFLLLIFMNCMFKYANSSSNSAYLYSENYLNSIKAELENLDPKNPTDVTLYINLKSEVELCELMNKYKDDEWKLSIINSRISSYLTERNTYLYGAEKSEEQANEITKKIEDITAKLDENNWKYFASQDLEIANKKIEELNSQKQQTQDKEILKNLENEIKNAEIEKEIAEYRLNKDIPYGTDYKNIALSRLQSASTNLIQYDSQETELSYEEQKDYNDSLKTEAECRYILDTGIDVNKNDSLKGILQNFYSEFGIFLIVVIVMIAGTIVSDEFNKGTIKLLLVKPYTRNKILLSKFITTVIIIFFVILSTVIMEMLVGGVLFGFDSLSVPVIEYNFNTNMLEEINVFAYLGIQTLAQLPMIVLLATLALVISTLFSNSALAITISLLGYMSTAIINQLALAYNLSFMKYFVTMNWDLSQFLFGNLPYMQGMSLILSIVICLVYLLVMLIPTFIIFKKRNIKNI